MNNLELDVNLIKCLEQSELHDVKEFVQNCSKSVAKRLGLYCKEYEEGFCCFAMTKHDILAFNRVIGFDLNCTINKQLLISIKDFYRSQGVPRFFLPLPPLDYSPTFESMLLAQGFSFYNNWPKLANYFTHSSEVKSPDIDVREASVNDQHIVASVLARAFEFCEDIGYFLFSTLGKKDWKFYLAYHQQEPIAAAGLHIQSNIGSLSIAGTIPQYRGLKAQKLLINKRIQAALNAGCKLIKSETGEDSLIKPNYSYQNMVKSNLELQYLRPILFVIHYKNT